jgi:hypothetical protein
MLQWPPTQPMNASTAILGHHACMRGMAACKLAQALTLFLVLSALVRPILWVWCSVPDKYYLLFTDELRFLRFLTFRKLIKFRQT